MEENKKKTFPWLTEGYKMVALVGFHNLTVEKLAKTVGKSKSSFYHHFVDLEIFINRLCEYHIERVKIIAVEESKCKNINPELIEYLVTIKIDLLFHKQLKIHSENPLFKKCIQKTTSIIEDVFVEVWNKEMEFNTSLILAKKTLGFSLDNFFLQINPNTIHKKWLRDYLTNLKSMFNSLSK
ncbi:TetR/AcrR family transcriptional regulator [uncultured Kordia sp.]|uniref:TetR/AcrR family transcriptional regulator n=1 Tax=uncultured Kordia sp. TaxID=507699 RepID=UPI002611115C|nr:TetR/AcrR family transcriptional regulator [uncultured Kordia sp.]